MNNRGRILAFATAGIALLTSTQLASANPLTGPSRSHGYVTIGGDRGGYVVQYALRVLKLRKSGTPLRFTGRCQSACTIYLALPRRQTCISPGASFSFHAPYGGGSGGNRIALSYMLNSYPSWVRNWINKWGGLSRKLITMDYAYASKFMRTCGSQTAGLDVTRKSKKS
jgi:hypothetical protein